ncbi:hypothetical protein OLEAN_C08530 [Oleispira antarctica RB-8]|uniref:Uncharacterized protein n=1 Tax=Oleispira antarctica RB-8 TaxID=698738 RepID=R4YSE5_OLEAN|nr:hypothetical protein OLEAN_C08530 [Oleispira antarctica RB-8]
MGMTMPMPIKFIDGQALISYDLRIREGLVKPKRILGFCWLIEKDCPEWWEGMAFFPFGDCYSQTLGRLCYENTHGMQITYFLFENGFPFGFYESEREAIQFQINNHRKCISGLENKIEDRKGVFCIHEYARSLSIFKRELRLFKGLRTRYKKNQKRLAELEYLDEWPF